MTKDEESNAKPCGHCSHLQDRHELPGGGAFGVCTNCQSEHFGHMIVSYHPVCEVHS